MKVSLKVGVVIPESGLQAGGARTFEQVVFKEILARRHMDSRLDGLEINYVPIAFTRNQLIQAQSLSVDFCSAVPPAFMRILSRFQSLFFWLIKPWVRVNYWRPVLPQTLSDKWIAKVLASSVDVLWYTTPYVSNTSVPFIFTAWDLEHRRHPCFPELLSDQIYKGRDDHLGRCLSSALFCVVGTKSSARELSCFYGFPEYRTFCNPLPCPPPMPAAIDASEPKSSRKYLVFPAQFWHHKNHLILLLALRRLIDESVQIDLVFTGSDKGSLTDVQHIVRVLGLAEYVKFAGFVEESRLSRLYTGSSGLVFPTFFGPDNLPPLEAMSYGVPVLISDLPGAREHYQDSVLYFNPNSSLSLACTIKKLLNDDGLRRTLIASGLEYVKSLTPFHYISNIEKLLEREIGMVLLCSRRRMQLHR